MCPGRSPAPNPTPTVPAPNPTPTATVTPTRTVSPTPQQLLIPSVRLHRVNDEYRVVRNAHNEEDMQRVPQAK